MLLQSAKRYVCVAVLSLVSYFILDFLCIFYWIGGPLRPEAGWMGSLNPPDWIQKMAVIIVVRSLYAFFTIGAVAGVGVSVKDLLQALPIYGPPAMCFFQVLARLGVPSWFMGSNPIPHMYHYWEFESWSFVWVGPVVQEFLRGSSYLQAIRGIRRMTPLAVTILGWHLLAGNLAQLVYAYGPLTAYIWFILYWSIILIQAYLVFRAEKQK